MADLIVVEQLRAYLVAQGIVRNAESAGAAPPCWLNPRDGAKEPVSPDLSAVTLVQTLAVPQDVLHQPFLQEPIVDVLIRATTSPRAELLQRAIRGVLADKRLLTMGDLLVERSLVWREDQHLQADDRTYTRVQSFRFLCRVKALQGLPYAP